MILQVLAGLAVVTALATPAVADEAIADRPFERPAPAHTKGEGDALLLSAAALARLRAAQAGMAPPGPTTALAGGPTLIHLSAIVHHGAEDWRIWVNGRSVTPASPAGPLHVLEVTPEWVSFAWEPPLGGTPIRVRLHPNQSYLIASGRIVEGRPRATAGATLGPSSPPQPTEPEMR